MDLNTRVFKQKKSNLIFARYFELKIVIAVGRNIILTYNLKNPDDWRSAIVTLNPHKAQVQVSI